MEDFAGPSSSHVKTDGKSANKQEQARSEA
jgi:hypothetical protein